MEYTTGQQLKRALMEGRPSRMKSASDYTGIPIPVCGEYANHTYGDTRTPWLSEGTEEESLHDEIVAFILYMTPTQSEIKMRQDLVARFSKLITTLKPGAKVQPIGSYVTGLFLPTSDIDLVLTPPPRHFGSAKLFLMTLESEIYSTRFASNIKAVLQASVPLLKITDAVTGIEIDLTIDQDGHGFRATQLMKTWIEDLDEEGILSALVLVMKQFLGMRKLATTYTGGVNSYLLVWLVVSWMKLEYPKEEDLMNANGIINLGAILISFLKFYGQYFDYTTTVINLQPTPFYGRKTYVFSRYGPIHQYLLSLKDPANESIDLGQKAYAIKHVQSSFREAVKDLQVGMRIGYAGLGEGGVLGQLLGGDYNTFLTKRAIAVMSMEE
ncbi:hypothetical protein BDD12DRAFT_750086 [Trichophaea hybrida]|nr:hypothetical protein BDD12DRAFT_750086 [Trichophaea hybrida]